MSDKFEKIGELLAGIFGAGCMGRMFISNWCLGCTNRWDNFSHIITSQLLILIKMSLERIRKKP